MGYENAAATKMVASHCACCGRALVDAVSVQTGVGPDCREKHGFYVEVDEEKRAEANVLVYKIALVQKGTEAFQACQKLHGLGFQKLAARIMERLTKIVLEEVDAGKTLAISTPWNPDFVERVKCIPGRRWDPQNKRWTIPTTVVARTALLAALAKCFSGKWAQGPRGPFVIGGEA